MDPMVDLLEGEADRSFVYEMISDLLQAQRVITWDDREDSRPQFRARGLPLADVSRLLLDLALVVRQEERGLFSGDEAVLVLGRRDLDALGDLLVTLPIPAMVPGGVLAAIRDAQREARGV